jgi:hypothetical protein
VKANIHCYCGRGYELPYKLKKELLVGFDAFCGEECLYQLLVDEGVENGIIEKHSLIYPTKMESPTEFWCRETRRYYRSRSEATFARWCEVNGIDWKYEPYTIRFRENQTYTPDFWLPEYSHFVEVKGIWAGSGKKKLRKAKEYGFNIVLVPNHLIYKLTRVRIIEP